MALREIGANSIPAIVHFLQPLVWQAASRTASVTSSFNLPMISRIAADLVVGVHAAFVIFVVLGGLLVVRWPRLVWVHVPAAVWGVLIEFAGWICPLTPLENYLRERSGLSTYQGDFVEHYVLPLLYPAHLTRALQIWLGTAALIINILLYWHVIRMKCRPGSVDSARGRTLRRWF